jgi:hypothetical protein
MLLPAPKSTSYNNFREAEMARGAQHKACLDVTLRARSGAFSAVYTQKGSRGTFKRNQIGHRSNKQKLQISCWLRRHNLLLKFARVVPNSKTILRTLCSIGANQQAN